MTREEKAEGIYKAALDVFGRYGFKKASVEDIASELSLSKGTLYLYASDKRDLYRRAVAWGFDQWQGRVKAAVALCSDPVAKLEALTHKAYAYLGENASLRSVLARDPDLFPVFASNDPYAEINHESMDMLKAVLLEGVESGVFHVDDIDAVAKSLFSIYVLFIQKMYVVQEGDEVNAMFENVMKLITRGLLATRD